jgi:hypothetical protein
MKQAMIDTMKNEKHDHFDTPAYAVKPLLPYINPKWTVWEPTDTTGKSQITKMLCKYGCKVVSTGKKRFDFLYDKPDFDYDCIVTNPPYSLKDEFIDAAMELCDRWALLLPLTALEGVRRRKLFEECGTDLGVLVLDRRVEYTGGSVWFNTSWFCCGILPRQLMFAELQKEQNEQTLRH